MKMHKWEWGILAVLFFTALLFFLLPLVSAKAGTVAIVSGPAIPTQSFSLDQDAYYQIEAALPVTLHVQDGKIRFENAVCPDRLCENTGWISKEGQQAICMPAGVVVTIA